MNFMRIARLPLVLWAIGVFCWGSGVRAAEFRDLSVDELKSKMESGEKIFLLNPLSDIEFNEGHIPDSVNIPLQELETTDKLPQDKGAPIVTYCLGPQ